MIKNYSFIINNLSQQTNLKTICYNIYYKEDGEKRKEQFSEKHEKTGQIP